MIDAAIVGSGPNGLVAANLLADAGWRVTVFEEQDEPGGAVKSAELIEPGFVSDLFSAFYPLGVASHTIRKLDVERWGVNWVKSQGVVAHPLPDGTCAIVDLDLETTCASVDAYHPGDGDSWRRLYDLYEKIGQDLLEGLMTPLPPLRAGLRMGVKLNRELLRFLRFGMLPVRRFGEENFRGVGGVNLLAANALHADLTPDQPGGALFGWLLCMLGQRHGFPVPEGGAGKLTEALIRRLRDRGGDLVCGQRVTRVLVRDRRAVGIVAGGEHVEVAKAVLADTGAPQLYLELIPREIVPPRVVEDLENFQYDASTVKVDWTLTEPIPWTARDARRAGTVHVTEGLDALTEMTCDIMTGRIPRRPFLILGQYSMVDPTRMPAGAESAWAYTHVPQRTKGDAGGDLTGNWADEAEVDAFVARIEDEVEQLAPGFKKTIRGRHVFTPPELEAVNRNLRGGAVNGGTAQLHQQLVFRPTPGLGRPETPVRGLYLASASAHPGGGVHGGPGGNAARVALVHDRLRSGPRRLLGAVSGR